MPSIQDDDSEDAMTVQFSGGPAFSEGALHMINSFLDQLLFSFIGTARSSTLAALRPAVDHILKGKLARNAIASGDAEIGDLLGETEDDDEKQMQKEEREAQYKWDLETVWRRTRLRIMVYTSIGEMEGDDEERYLQEERAREGDECRFNNVDRHVSWSAVIFLTSALEYVAEQCVIAVGQAAYDRIAFQRASEDVQAQTTKQGPLEERPLVKAQDVEKLSLNSSLCRVWRIWRKSMRASRSSPRVVSASWSASGTHPSDHSSLSNASDRSLTDGMRPFWSNSLRIEGINDPRLLSEISRQSTTVGDEAASNELQKQQQLPRRTRSTNRFPVNVNSPHIHSWQKRVARTRRPAAENRARSQSLPTPRKETFSVGLDSGDGPPSGQGADRSMNTETVREREADESGDMKQPESELIQEGEYRHGRQAKQQAPSDEKHRVAEDQLEAPEAQDENDHFTDSIQRQEKKRPPSEYDPFRFDAEDPNTPVKPPAVPFVSHVRDVEGSSPREREMPASSTDTSEGRLTPKLEGAVAGSAILGSTMQNRKARRPEQLSVSTSAGQQSNSRNFATVATGQPHDIAVEPSTIPQHVASPGEATPCHEVPHQTPQSTKPSPLAGERKNTDESSSAYETPQGSPGNIVTESKAVEEKPSDIRHTLSTSSRLAKAVNPVATRSGRTNSKGQKASKTSTDSNDRHMRPDSPSIQSEKEFSSFVSSDETLKRSLTPQNLREIEVRRKYSSCVIVLMNLRSPVRLVLDKTLCEKYHSLGNKIGQDPLT